MTRLMTTYFVYECWMTGASSELDRQSFRKFTSWDDVTDWIRDEQMNADFQGRHIHIVTHLNTEYL